MKGIFIPEITVEMFRDGCLEAIEALMVEGEIYDIEYDLKSAQLERKKEKWKEHDYDEDKYDVIKCPCCMHMFTVDSFHWTDIGFVKDDFKFCPNCGADMREGESE